MMTAIWMAVALLGGGPDSPTLDEQPVAAPEPEALSPLELRDAIRDAMRASRADDAEMGRVVPQLVDAYKQLEDDKQLSNSERSRLTHVLRSRMIAVGDMIYADLKKQRAREKREAAKAKREAAKAAREAGSSGGRPEDYPLGEADDAADDDDEGSAGGGAEREGDALIDLIRTTIAPDSWDINGGPGTIYYYYPLKALVVRNTGETHWLIRDLRQQLGK